MLKTIKWDKEEERLFLIDQTKLPNEVAYPEVKNTEEVYRAIKDMIVRGAPAIGVTAGYGMYFAAGECKESPDFLEAYKKKGDYLISSRPTAVNLARAVERMEKRAEELIKGGEDLLPGLKKEAEAIHREDIETNRKIGENLLSLVKDGDTILTHCNAGSLATSEYGTALSVFYLAKEKNIKLKAYADETRPRLQGARLTSFELYELGVDVTLITDSMAAILMREGKIDQVIVGADRVARNGDLANKVGTFSLSLIAKYFQVPFYVAAPTSTIDLKIASGREIPIEERGGDEIRKINGVYIAPEKVKVYNPSFDVTPFENVTALVTERGIVRGNFEEKLPKLFQ